MVKNIVVPKLDLKDLTFLNVKTYNDFLTDLIPKTNEFENLNIILKSIRVINNYYTYTIKFLVDNNRVVRYHGMVINDKTVAQLFKRMVKVSRKEANREKKLTQLYFVIQQAEKQSKTSYDDDGYNIYKDLLDIGKALNFKKADYTPIKDEAKKIIRKL